LSIVGKERVGLIVKGSVHGLVLFIAADTIVKIEFWLIILLVLLVEGIRGLHGLIIHYILEWFLGFY